MAHAPEYDYQIVNDTLDAAYARLRDIYMKETEKANG